MRAGATPLGYHFEENAGAVLGAARLLGLVSKVPSEWFAGEVDNSNVAEAVAERLAFIRDKNWAEADRIRDELLAQGIQLKDGKDPATGERVTTWEVKR